MFVYFVGCYAQRRSVNQLNKLPSKLLTVSIRKFRIPGLVSDRFE